MPESTIATIGTSSAIGKQKPTEAQKRLRQLDPDLAALMDTWDADLNRDYDLALNDQPAPPILDEEEKLAFELGRFALAADPLIEVASKVREARDAAYMTLGRVEQLIAQRTLEALQLTPQAALSPPPGGGNGGDGDPLPPLWPDPADYDPEDTADTGDAFFDEPTLVVEARQARQSGGWWQRVRTAAWTLAGTLNLLLGWAA